MPGDVRLEVTGMESRIQAVRWAINQPRNNDRTKEASCETLTDQRANSCRAGIEVTKPSISNPFRN